MSNSDPSIGLEAWEARRKAWTTPNEQYEANIERIKKNSEKCQELIKQEGQRIAIYKHLVLQRETFHTPISLKYIVCEWLKFFYY